MFEQSAASDAENIEEEIKLPPSIQEVLDRSLHFENDEEYKQEAIKNSDNKEVSEDAFVRTMKAAVENLKEGTSPKIHSLYGTLLRILERDSMKKHPDMELFKQAVQDLAEMDGHELKVRDGYWEELK